MEDAEVMSDGIVHLSRLALSGRPQDVQQYVRRLSRKMRAIAPDAAAKMGALLEEHPTRAAPVRSSTVESIPVDRDSRLQLLRVEHPATLTHDPVWAPSVQAQLDQVIAEHNTGDALLQAGLSATRTMLFTGRPGVGKTLAARWLAARMGLPLLILDLSAVMSSFLGRTGSNVRNVFDYAKGVRCLLLLDELDAIAKKRDDVTEIGELKRLVTVLLQEVDDWPAGSLLVAATNHWDLLDPAVWRRFESVVEFPMPEGLGVRRAIETFMAADVDSIAEWVGILQAVLHAKSFSEIETFIMLVRRASIVQGQPLASCLEDFVGRIASDLPRADRIALARQLVEKGGCSQRRAHELTGVSRDTIRGLQETRPVRRGSKRKVAGNA